MRMLSHCSIQPICGQYLSWFHQMWIRHKMEQGQLHVILPYLKINSKLAQFLKCKQECIPVGCVPAAHWPYSGVCFPGGWGCLLPGGSAPRGGSSPGGGGCSQRGGRGWWWWYPSMHWGRHPPPLWTESQTPVKTLPWPNFVTAGNKWSEIHSTSSLHTVSVICTLLTIERNVVREMPS